MIASAVRRATRIGDVAGRDRLLLAAPSTRVRHIAALATGIGLVALLEVLIRERGEGGWSAFGRLTWTLALLIAVVTVTRGLSLGRPVVGAHAVLAVAMLATGLAAHVLGRGIVGDVLVVSAAVVLTWPAPSPFDPKDGARVRPLVAETEDDPLAPFAVASTKRVFFGVDGSAAVTYHTRVGVAVVSGDPVGDPEAFPAVVDQFATMCRELGWRIAVLGCSERRLGLWRGAAVAGQRLKAVPIGRDVVIDVESFTMQGRAFRNLRQAVRRTEHSGVTTELLREDRLTRSQRRELEAVVRDSHRQWRFERGFSMTLDHALEGRYPSVVLMVARDRHGTAQAFQRYALAGSGSDVSLDIGWRRPGTPNGIDERMTIDMVSWCRERGVKRMSLAFAPFPELFESDHRTVALRIAYRLTHVADPLIKLESLYRYLRKFHALGAQRYVLVPMWHLPTAVVALISLEFMPRAKKRGHPQTEVPGDRAFLRPIGVTTAPLRRGLLEVLRTGIDDRFRG
ncbi:bifunctional lysylphosphatidylglycerol flippase/synthetase MprF [Mycolicibacterium sp. J2]|uniref:bifunctional lysylphosphatidylglycerol flippase/synthetase MprF n=1 Tax=Mycolicibacterium sp. J2 TaxID=2993511 RepID=UPI00224A7BB7|nr:phosphatidylglycerol lysyltransferase domain-containing protein [Mycolicibacterium sp. J2]MCX2710860.1 phosphatidylglycerol lysyltransferase domain-containing protein [Mycolicibacterium sp. J2]